MRVVRDALRVRRCSSGSGVKLEREKRPPPLRVRPPPTQNIHRGGRRGLGMLPPQSACWEGKNKPENGEEEWGASIGNDGVGDLGFFWGGGQRRSDVLTPERKSGGAATPPPSPPPNPRGLDGSDLQSAALASIKRSGISRPGVELRVVDLGFSSFIRLVFCFIGAGVESEIFPFLRQNGGWVPPILPPPLPPSPPRRKEGRQTNTRAPFASLSFALSPLSSPNPFLHPSRKKEELGGFRGALRGALGRGGGGETRNASKPDK